MVVPRFTTRVLDAIATINVCVQCTRYSPGMRICLKERQRGWNLFHNIILNVQAMLGGGGGGG